MSKIGDLWFGLRADDKTLQAEIRKSGEKGGDTFGLEMARSLKKSWSGAEIGKGLVQGLGLAGGLGAARLFSTAISKVGDVLSDANAAALAEEDSVARLDSQLRTSIKGWDGSTAAIEKTLTARMKLGFSDDEQRESLVRLLPVYKDIDKAQAVERTAMDLARFKKISLAEATLGLITIEGGQYRSLKQLIGSTKDITTSEEALAAVTAAVGNAAEDAAKMNSGKLLSSQIKVGEAMEKLGARTMPLVVAGTVAAADAIEELTTQADALTTAVGPAGVGGFLDFLGGVLAGIPTAGAGVSTAANKMATDWLHAGDAVAEAATTTETATGKMADDVRKSTGAFGSFRTKVVETGRQVKETAKAMATRITEWKDSVLADAYAVINGYYDPLITADKLLATNAEISANARIVASETVTEAERTAATKSMTAAQERIYNSKHATAAEKADARTALLALGKDRETLLTDLAAAGATGSKAYRTAIAALETEFKTASGERKAAILAELAYWRTLNTQVHKVATTIGNSGIGAGANRGGNRAYAAGAWSIPADEVALIHRREMVVPAAAASAVRAGQAMVTAQGVVGASGGGFSPTINVYNPEPHAAEPDIGRVLRRAASLGMR